ncbi:unnamed protein product [Ixodes pacificus]
MSTFKQYALRERRRLSGRLGHSLKRHTRPNFTGRQAALPPDKIPEKRREIGSSFGRSDATDGHRDGYQSYQRRCASVVQAHW